MVDPALEGVDDVLGDQPDADAVGVGWREDLGSESRFDLLELGLAELALEGRGEEDEVGALGVGDGLEVAVVDGDGGGAGDDCGDDDDVGVLVPVGPSPAAAAAGEVLELLVVGAEGVERAGLRGVFAKMGIVRGAFGWGLGSEEERGEEGLGFSEEIHWGLRFLERGSFHCFFFFFSCFGRDREGRERKVLGL